jgi:hypothetical protein
MKTSAYLSLIAVVAAAAVIAGADETLRIQPIVRDSTVVVSCELGGAYTDEVRDAIASGLRTTFTYDVQLRMVVPVWIDRTVAAAVVTITDQYDNLTRRHALSRAIDGKIEEAIVTEDGAVARRWLTKLDDVPLCATAKLDQSRDYYVRVSAEARPRAASLLGLATVITGVAKFTFVP